MVFLKKMSVLSIVLMVGITVRAGESKLENLQLRPVVYHVGDLCRGRDGKPNPNFDLENLAKRIKQGISVDSWSDGVAPSRTKPLGTITPFPETTSLIVCQTEEVHNNIRVALQWLRGDGIAKRIGTNRGPGQVSIVKTKP